MHNLFKINILYMFIKIQIYCFFSLPFLKFIISTEIPLQVI